MNNQKKSAALKISLIYALIGVLWILLSDRAGAALFGNPKQFLMFQTYKGWFYVISTALLLFTLIKNEKKTLKIAEQNFSDLFESTTEGMFRSSPSGHFINVNTAMAHIYGYDSPKEMIETITNISAQIHLSAESRRAFTEALEQNNAVENFKARNRKKDGGIIWTSTNAHVARDEQGKILYYEGFVTDITKQKNAEDALFAAEEHYRMLVEKLPAVIFLDKFNQPSATQYISPRLINLVGYTPEEWSAGNVLWESSLHPEDKERVIAEDHRTDQTGEPFRIEYRLRHRQGHYIWVKEDASLVTDENGAPLFWQGIMLDITDQKNAKAPLERRDAIIKAVGFSAERFLKPSNWEESINPILEQLGKATNVSRVYVIKKNVSSAPAVIVSQIFEWCNEGIKPQIENEKLQNKDFIEEGFSRWIDSFNKGLPVIGLIKNFPASEQSILQEQNILSLICIPLQIKNDWWGFIGFDDCTQEREWTEVEIEAIKTAANTLSAAMAKKISHDALQNSEASYRGLFNSIHDAIFIQDSNGIFLDANNGAVKMYGYPKKYFLGKTLNALSAPNKNNTDKIMQSIHLAFRGEMQEIEIWGKRSSGSVFPKNIRLFKGTYFGQDVVIAVAQDITDRKRAEDDLQKQVKELSVLHAIAQAESVTINVDELMRQITNIIGETLHPHHCGILLLNETGDMLKPHPSYRGISRKDMDCATPLNVGITGKVASTGKSIRSGNVSLESAYSERIQGIHSELCVPISAGTTIIGVLNIESEHLNAFTRSDERLLNTIAKGMSKAIERIQLFKLEEKRRKQAEILREATGELTSLFNTEKLFENIFNSLSKLIGYTSASIEVINQGYFEIIAGKNIPDTLIGKKYKSNLEKWGDLINKRQPIIIEDVQQDERFEKFEETSYIHGWMTIPMFIKDTVVGFLNLDSKTPGYFNKEHAAIAQTFANQAAIAMENIRLFEMEQKRRKEAEIIRQAAAVLTSLLDLPALQEAILEWLYKIKPYDSAAILELEGNRIRITAIKGSLIPENALGQEFLTDNTLCKIISETYKPVIIEDCEEDPRFEGWGSVQHVRGWMGVPMLSRGQVIGYITLDSRTPNNFTQNEAITVQTFAHQAATSLENSRLFTETKQRLEELEIVSRVSFALRAAHDAQEMLPIILNEIQASVNTDSAAIWLYDGECNELISRAAAGWFTNLPKSNIKPNEGVIGMVYSNSTVYATTDSNDDPIRSFFGENKSGIAVPIRTVNETIGALAVTVQAPRKAKTHQIRLVTTLAEIAGNAIYRSTLYEKSEEQIQRLTTLRELDTAITSSLDLRITLGILTEHLIKKMGVSAVSILLFNAESKMLDNYAVAGFKNNKNVSASLSLSDGLCGQILLNRKELFIKDLTMESNLFTTRLCESEEFTSYYAIPLFSKGAAKGVLEAYFRQPFSLNPDWVEFIHTLAEQAVIAIDNAQLFENLQRTNQELALAYDITLEGWGKALELRDKETQGHTQRVTRLTLQLARKMDISEAELLQIRRGALLHDIGKMGVPDRILHKNGELTEEERAEMRKHPQYAYDMLYPIEYLRPALDIVYYHHEWWDGSGYPHGLCGEEIPLAARIFAIIDVWDALSSDRPYRSAWKPETILGYIRNLSGKQFDPQVVETFFRMMEEP